MQDIKCPNCEKAFKIDEAGYASILKQVRDSDFDHQLSDRLALAEREKQAALQLAQNQGANELEKAVALKNASIQDLQAKLENAEIGKKLAIQETSSSKDQEISDLKSQLREIDSDKKLELALAIAEIEKKLAATQSAAEKSALQKSASETALKERYEAQLKDRDAEIQRIQDFKAKLSTKMVGETLEQHCETEFNRVRPMAFPNADFHKDNDASSGSKGDFVFRESNASDVEIISIMFEMKNENDDTATKKKNDDFLKELDKDRREKNCEFAVLVSMLESDSDYYNDGIVDVSHRYPKMYVIRPQFFLALISLLRNAALGALEYKNELALVRAQSIDVSDFEDNLEVFQSGFQRNYTLANTHFLKSVEEIDKSISHLTKTKESLIKTANQLRLANEKAQEITIKKLTSGNPTMAAKFEELNSKKE